MVVGYHHIRKPPYVSFREDKFLSQRPGHLFSHGRLPRSLRSKKLILLHDISLEFEAYANIDPQKMAILFKGVTFSKAYPSGN